MTNAYGLSIPNQLVDVCKPARCALIVYDMQVGIVPQISAGREIVVLCRRLLEAARAGGYRIFFTRHFFLPNNIAGVGQLRRAMVWQRTNKPEETKPFFLQGSPPWEIVPELAPREGEVVIDKITMSAFEGTFLNLAMRDAHLDCFIIAASLSRSVSVLRCDKAWISICARYWSRTPVVQRPRMLANTRWRRSQKLVKFLRFPPRKFSAR